MKPINLIVLCFLKLFGYFEISNRVYVGYKHIIYFLFYAPSILASSLVFEYSLATYLLFSVFFSEQGRWHSVIAYDACVRLCLHSWAGGCMEAPIFLENECALLRSSFGSVHCLPSPT